MGNYSLWMEDLGGDCICDYHRHCDDSRCINDNWTEWRAEQLMMYCKFFRLRLEEFGDMHRWGMPGVGQKEIEYLCMGETDHLQFCH